MSSLATRAIGEDSGRAGGLVPNLRPFQYDPRLCEAEERKPAVYMTLTRRYKLATVFALAVVAFGFRAYELSAAGLSEDEVNKVVAARGYLRGDFGQNLEHPMLMKLAIAGCLAASDLWNERLGHVAPITEEAAARLPNVLAGTAMTLVIYLLAELMLGAPVGLLAAAFWSTGVLAIAVNRVAKEDTLLILFCWLGFYFYERAKRLAAGDAAAEVRRFALAGASFGLMLASKYFAHYLGLLFLFYHLAGESETNRPLTRRALLSFLGAMALAFLAFNPSLLLPGTWLYLLDYSGENTVSHHGYVLMGRLYQNTLSATPGGLPVYFYALMLAVKTPLVVAAAFLLGFGVAVRRRNERGMFLLLFMFVMWIVPFSLVAGKWLRYVVAVLPAFYTLGAVGVVAVARAASSRIGAVPRAVTATAVATAAVLAPAAAAAAAAPHYSLYLNAIGGDRKGWYFPHDELYDAGLREAIATIAAEAPPGSLVLGEAPPVWRYYLARLGREELRFYEMSEFAGGPDPSEAAYVVVQDGRRYFENAAFIAAIESSRQPDVTVTVDGAEAARIYRVAAPPGAAGVPR